MKFEDGTSAMLKKEEAEEYAQRTGKIISFDASKRPQFKTMVKDGFSSGYNPALGQSFGGPREYAKYLARNKLEEMGKTKPELTAPKTPHFNKEDLEEIIRNTDAKIDGVMVDKLIKDGPAGFVEAAEDLENVPQGGFISEYGEFK